VSVSCSVGDTPTRGGCAPAPGWRGRSRSSAPRERVAARLKRRGMIAAKLGSHNQIQGQGSGSRATSTAGGLAARSRRRNAKFSRNCLAGQKRGNGPNFRRIFTRQRTCPNLGKTFAKLWPGASPGWRLRRLERAGEVTGLTPVSAQAAQTAGGQPDRRVAALVMRGSCRPEEVLQPTFPK
jgi:hypothetical protein